MLKTIVVVGVTGNQGAAVAKHFAQDPNWHVRGVTRNPSSEAAKALTPLNIELVTADLDDPAPWPAILRGAHALFVVTDFWQTFGQEYAERSKLSDRATAEYAADVETRRAKTVLNAAAQALADEGTLERVVYSTLPHWSELSGGKYTYCYHFDGKAKVREYIERELPQLWKITSTLNMGVYYTNFSGDEAGIAGFEKLDDGTYSLEMAGDANGKHPFIYPPEVGNLTKILVESNPGINLLAISQWLTHADMVAEWGEVLGVKAVAKSVTVDDLDKKMPGGLGKIIGESFACSSEVGWGKLTLPSELDPHIKHLTWKEWVKSRNWDKVIN